MCGVGDLSAVCGIAGSLAKHVPVVFVSGVPPLYAKESRLRVHHSLAEGNFNNVMNCLKEFTVVNTRLTSGSAVEEIDRALHRCRREKKPAYIQAPSNISYLMVDAPDDELQLNPPASDPERDKKTGGRILFFRLRPPFLPSVLMAFDPSKHPGPGGRAFLCLYS